jgi:hypothetical protein
MRLGTNSCETFGECGYMREETKFRELSYDLHSRSRSYLVHITYPRHARAENIKTISMQDQTSTWQNFVSGKDGFGSLQYFDVSMKACPARVFLACRMPTHLGFFTRT